MGTCCGGLPVADSEASGYEGESAKTLGQDKDRLIRKKKKGGYWVLGKGDNKGNTKQRNTSDAKKSSPPGNPFPAIP